VLYRAKPDDPVARAIDASLRRQYSVEQEIPFHAVTVVKYRSDR
jgi:hypothetical protein